MRISAVGLDISECSLHSLMRVHANIIWLNSPLFLWIAQKKSSEFRKYSTKNSEGNTGGAKQDFGKKRMRSKRTKTVFDYIS
jgi:hypothetical protein